MKRIGIIAYSGAAHAFAAAAIKAVQAAGIDVHTLSADELEREALARAPIDFPVFKMEPPTAAPHPRYAGYMKRANRRRY